MAQIGRRTFLSGLGGSALATLAVSPASAAGQPAPVDLALVAALSASVGPDIPKPWCLSDSAAPQNSSDDRLGVLRLGHDATAWVQYDWAKPVTFDRIRLYWQDNGWDAVRPQSYRIAYWNGSAFVPVAPPHGGPLAKDDYDTTVFAPVRTAKLRLELTGTPDRAIGLLRWHVYGVGPVPNFPPAVAPGVDRLLVAGGRTYLNGKAAWLQSTAANVILWSALSSPGAVGIADASALQTTATATVPGDYTIQLTGRGQGGMSAAALRLRVADPPPAKRLDVVYTTAYEIDSPFWQARAKALIVNWIPHCIAMCERTDLKVGAGGIDNFIEAAKALRGAPHAGHKGHVFANAWVHQTLEAMCIALMVAPGEDREIAAAQAHMRATLETWIPIILAAQEPDGYLQTAYTLADRKEWPTRWSADHRGNHEGYVAGYFIESAINHYTLTGGKDRRLYDGAKKLADCWVANIGPGRKAWFDGHQEMEQALVRFGRFVNDMEGNGAGDAYIRLARFLLESRRGGSQYDQSHLPPVQQYEAVGHAVRAVYFYSGMADIAAETEDVDYQSAVLSLWDNMTNRKYYVTGGIGSGDTSEGFGENYALGNDAYCESCSSCGQIFFQYKLNLAYHDARFADLYEETMYNALLGSLDLDGKSYTYTNPLIDTVPRYGWHDCPCCVGNIPRTLLMMPTWAYAKSESGIYVNLFVGSRINVGKVAGTELEMVQKTEYPWNGRIAIAVNPAQTCEFSVHIRIPERKTSVLYDAVPQVQGLLWMRLNGKSVTPRIENGYAVLTRRWRKGDTIELELPMAVQKITADARIAADRNKTALRFGPLVYNVELADQPRIDLPLGPSPLNAHWRSDLLGGVMAISGTWKDGAPLLAIPNYARMNRAGPPTDYPAPHGKTVLSQVWIAT